MTTDKLTLVSKYMSFVLRHQPGSIGLTLDAQGWARIDELIACATRDGKTLTKDLIEEVVAKDVKRRYALSDDGTMIRANQGHSVTVDLQLEPAEPPEVLYHGTAERSLPVILKQGLKPMKRHHVHLSKDQPTALAVGKRYGHPVILLIQSAQMHRAGHIFYLSQNDVWLTDSVPVAYIQILS
ncbi:MAG: RNA 2'-phosphotransferase [Candidatus Omnitrophica bacterium]|nr:RNA 2'-phosphotransferase [Candidatus Omnitrophota bacterium]